MIKIGELVMDLITEKEGIAVSRTEYLGGTVVFEVQPKNTVSEPFSVVAQRLQRLGSGIRPAVSDCEKNK